MTDAPKGSLGFSAGTDAAEENLETKLKRQNWIFFDNVTSILQQLTTFKKVVNRPDLQDPLHVLMQYANFRLPIGVNDKFCERRKLFNILDGNDSCNLPSCAAVRVQNLTHVSVTQARYHLLYAVHPHSISCSILQ